MHRAVPAAARWWTPCKLGSIIHPFECAEEILAKSWRKKTARGAVECATRVPLQESKLIIITDYAAGPEGTADRRRGGKPKEAVEGISGCRKMKWRCEIWKPSNYRCANAREPLGFWGFNSFNNELSEIACMSERALYRDEKLASLCQVQHKKQGRLFDIYETT